MVFGFAKPTEILRLYIIMYVNEAHVIALGILLLLLYTTSGIIVDIISYTTLGSPHHCAPADSLKNYYLQ